jgi:hypothetical protein
MKPKTEWTGEWVALKLRDDQRVVAVNRLSPTLLEVDRVDNGQIIVATVAKATLDEVDLLELYNQDPPPQFVVNVTRESALTFSALQRSVARGIPVGGLGDIKRALVLADVTEYVKPEIDFVERGLRQHSRVSSFERVDERRYRVIRSGLPPLVVVLINEYDLTADHLRTARDRYGAFDRVLVTNPNGRITTSALEVAESISVIAGHWGDFMKDLHK